MRVLGVEIRRLRLALVRPLRAAHGVEHERRILIVRVVTDVGDGWGECSALSRPTYLADHLPGAELVLRDVLVPEALAAIDVDPGRGVGGALVGHRTARAALDGALLDAHLRASGVSLAAWLGADRSEVGTGATVGADTIDDMCGAALAAVDRGAARIKIKVAPGRATEPVRAVAAVVGDRAALHVDANGSFDLSTAEELMDLADLGVTLVEQPVAAGDLVGSAHVQRMLGATVDVCLDESIDSPDAVSTMAALGSGRVVSVKVARLGGVGPACATIDRAAAAGVGVLIGGMWESGLGRRIAVALAALPTVDRLGDLGPTADYLGSDLLEPIPRHRGRLEVWAGPGMAPRPDEGLLEELTEEIVLRSGDVRL